MLPQGKFSEFLKLEGMERNKMLERLFHLERYGEQLVTLIKAKELQWDSQKQAKEGALSRYEEVRVERIRTLKQQELDFCAQLQKKEAKLGELRKKLEESRHIAQYQEEYERLSSELQKQNAMQDEILTIQDELKKAEKANALWEYLQSAEQARLLAEDYCKEKDMLYSKWQKKLADVKLLKKEKDRCDLLMQETKPQLELLKAKLEDALVFSEEKRQQEQMLLKYQKEAADIQRELEDDCSKMNGLIKDIENKEDKKGRLLQEIRDNTVRTEVQQAIEEGFRLYKELQEFQKKDRDIQKRINMWNTEKEQLQTQLEQLLTQEKSYDEQEKKLEAEIIQIMEKRTSVQKDSEAFYVKNFAAVLAAGLKEGEPCPVCGNRHHILLLHDNEQEQSQNSSENGNLAALQNEYQVQNRRMELLEKELDEKEHRKQFMRENLHMVQTQKTAKETMKENLTIRQKEAKADWDALKTELDARLKKQEEISRYFQIDDFADAYTKLQEKNKNREEKQTLLEQLENALDARRKNREKGDLIIQSKRTKAAQLEIMLEQVSASIKDLEGKILKRAGNEGNPRERSREITLKLQKINQEYQETAALWEQQQQEEVHLHQKHTAKEALAASAEQEVLKKEQFLKEKMKELQVPDQTWILHFRKEESVLVKSREKTEAFKETALKLAAEIARVKRQLNGKSVSKEELEHLETKLKCLETDITRENQTSGAVKKELEQLEKAWKEKKSLENTLKEIYHKLDILAELDSLFRGKKFVEYVSRYYLEHVSREADACLKEMTGSSYGLETDGNGMFVIRDYKNGGVSRPASTLSGGETFLASLALALALSSQIQMKGAAPLELFFLDEGFGTLDETYLEVVMEALEKIRNKRRSVGVITHVEEIKARIPIRLLVEPAKMGEGGSRVQIEHA